MKVDYIFDLFHVGLGMSLYRNSEFSDYCMTLDIQLLQLNVWIMFVKKLNK